MGALGGLFCIVGCILPDFPHVLYCVFCFMVGILVSRKDVLRLTTFPFLASYFGIHDSRQHAFITTSWFPLLPIQTLSMDSFPPHIVIATRCICKHYSQLSQRVKLLLLFPSCSYTKIFTKQSMYLSLILTQTLHQQSKSP